MFNTIKWVREMTIRDLEIFIAVCDCKSITEAAKELFISQPAISISVKRLEEHYNTKLFDRISKRLHITEAGKMLLDRSRHLISLFNTMEICTLDGIGNNLIKIGSSITVGNCLLPNLLKQYNEKFKHIKTNVIIANSKKIEDMVVENNVDIAIIENIPTSDKIYSQKLSEDEIVVICGSNHPLAHRNSIRPIELTYENLLLREKESGSRILFQDVLRTHNIVVEPTWESVSTQAIVNAVRLGIGISALPYKLVQNSIANKDVCMVRVDGITFFRCFYIIWHKDKYISKPLEEFISISKSYI